MTIDIYSQIKYPQMRQLLLSSLISLSDKVRQIKEWVRPEYKHSFWDNLMFDVHVIFDDLELDKNPDDQIGYFLVDTKESKSIKELVKIFEVLLETIGEKQSDTMYLNSPLWNRLVKSAKIALEIFVENENNYKRINPVAWKALD